MDLERKEWKFDMVGEIATENTESESLYKKCKRFLAENGNEIIIGIGIILILLNMFCGVIGYSLENITMGFIIYLLIDQRLAHMELFSFESEFDNEEEKEN